MTALSTLVLLLLLGAPMGARAMRAQAGTVSERLHQVFEKMAASGEVLQPMQGLFTDSKFEYDPRPGRDFESRTIIEMLETAAAKHPEELAFRVPHQDEKGNLVKKGGDYTFHLNAKAYKYTKYTWKQYRDLVMDAAAAFVKMGLQPMDAVNIRGVNSAEWMIAFLGCIAAGGLPVGLYPTDSDKILEFKAQDSGAAFIVLGKAADLSAYAEFLDRVPSVKAVILWDGKFLPEEVDQGVLDKINQGERAFKRWGTFISEGQGEGSVEYHSAVQERIRGLRYGQAATVVYTSGTTGNPKGVMLSHDAVTWAAEQTATIVDRRPKNGQHRIVSYLPLNHVAGQMLDIIYPLFVTQSEDTHATIFFPATCYLKKQCIAEQLVDAKPTIFLGVPEVWDGLRLKIEQATASGLKAFIRQHKPRLVLKGVGLHKVMYAITGAGPITQDTLRFFHTMGISILNIFAQSESSALGTAWSMSDFDREDLATKFGSIGKPLGNEVRIDPKTSEIMLRGRNVMLGYLNRLDKTRDAITSEGWLKTGDKGRQDGQDFVFIVGRIKEIMKSHGGEMIAPVAIEEGIKKACNRDGLIIKQAIVQGDGKQYLSVLLTVIEEAAEGIPTGRLAGAALEVDPKATRVAHVHASQAWNARLTACITEANSHADKSPEKVWRYAVLPADITAESAPLLMTPTFKIRRDGVAAKYSDVIAACGGDPAQGPLAGSLAPVRACDRPEPAQAPTCGGCEKLALKFQTEDGAAFTVRCCGTVDWQCASKGSWDEDGIRDDVEVLSWALAQSTVCEPGKDGVEMGTLVSVDGE